MKIRAMEARSIAVAIHAMVFAVLVTIASPTIGQDQLVPGTPGRNVNIVGPTPTRPIEREVALRQQNEPHCARRSDNPAYILCAYNDYRTTDFPLINPDTWIGVSMSADFGKTWFSRLAPGYLAHPNALGFEFAADPNVASVPGNSPGIAIISYIAANRDQNSGGVFVQRAAEMAQEDIDFWRFENRISTADSTNSGRFGDRPSMLPIVDPPDVQTTQSITMQLEDGSTVVRNVPSGRLLICYSIFTGSNSSKIVCKISFDWGETFTKIIKLSEEQVRVQGVALTNIGDTVFATWRRADPNKGIGNSLMTAMSTDGGETWTKGREAAGLCPIDQASTGAQIRLLDIPTIASDGKYIYIIASDRRFGGDQGCTTGIPKAAMTWSTNGRNWSDLQPLDVAASNPFGEPSGNGFQYITEAVGARGSVYAFWFDNRRESPLPQPEPAQMRDYIAAGGIVNRKSDVYGVKIRADDSGVPQVSPAVRVSRYRTLLTDPSSGQPLPVPQETEAHFPNSPIFEEGTAAFNGDYITAAVAWFRRLNGDEDPEGPYIQNSLSTGIDALDTEDVWVAWGDLRDLRGNYLATADEQPSPYTPNNAVTTARAVMQESDSPLLAGDNPAGNEMANDVETSTMRTEAVGDEPGTPGQCIPDDPQDRTRDANVYGTMLRAASTLVAPTPSKPLVGFQRTIPVVVTNGDEIAERSLTLKIMTQPSDFDPVFEHTGHGSWNQLPSKPPLPPGAEVVEIPVTVPPKSYAARTLFLISNDPQASVLVNLYDGDCVPGAADCPALASIVVGGGDELRESNFCEANPGPTCQPVNSLETHDPELQNPDLQSPDLQSVRLLSPDLQSPDLQSPDLQSPDLQSLGFATPDLQSPDLQSPDLQSPDLQSPDLQSPDLQSPDLQSAAYRDVSYTIQATGNVTTSFTSDMAFTGLSADEITAQLIASTSYITATSRGCEYLPMAENQILVSKNLTQDELTGITLPTVQDPYAGPISFWARPGQWVTVTLRVFGPAELLDSLSEQQFTDATSFVLSAQACNDAANIDPTTDCLTIGVEKLLSDSTGPAFVGLQNGDVIPDSPIEADRTGGACLDLVGGADPLVAATDPSGIASIGCSLIGGGQPICSSTEPGTSVPLMTDPLDPSTAARVSCTAVDQRDNSSTIEIGVAVADRTAPTISGAPTVTSLIADAALGTAVLTLEDGLVASDADNVDPSPVISCTATGDSIPGSAISGEAVGPGAYDVACVATDASNNASAAFDYSLTVVDVTAPVLVGVPDDFTGVEAQGPGGAVVGYVTPTANDTAGDATVECSPPSGSTFALGSTSVTCTATDASGNIAEDSFSVTVVDTTPPDISVPDEAVLVPADASGFGTLDFEAQVVVTDLVDTDPDISCSATPGGASSGDPLPIGSYEVTCEASDDVPNTSSASYTVRVQFGASFGIDFAKFVVKSGSSAPSTFGWLDAAGNRIDSSGANPVVSARTCNTNQVVLNPGQFPGNSELRYDASRDEWKFIWQTVFTNGDPIPTGLYCVQVESLTTGQTIPDNDGFTEIRVRD